MEICKVIVPYGLIWTLFLTIVIIKYRRRKYPVCLYLANLVLYITFYVKKCQHISVSLQFHDNPASLDYNFDDFQEKSKKINDFDELFEKPSSPLKMPTDWESVRHNVKQKYINRHVKIQGHNYKDYLKSAPYESLPVEPWEVKELLKGGFPEVWFSGVEGVEKNKINESATNRGLDFPEEDEEEGGKYSARF